MKIIKSLILLICLNSWTLAQTKWKATTYNISFKIKHVAGATAEGKFSGLKCTINFDEELLGASDISATLDAATFNTGNGARDKTLKGEEYFNVMKFSVFL